MRSAGWPGAPRSKISGGVNQSNLRAFGSAHPDYISVGFITHSAPALDMSMKVIV